MGKMPLVGVVGTLCLGLSLAGCESCGSSQKSTYQGQGGNIRGLVNGSPQPGTQPTSQAAAAQTTPTSTTSTTTQTGATGAAIPTSTTSAPQAWNTPPAKMNPATQTYPNGTAAPMPTGPGSNAGTFMPTGGTVPPVINTGTPVGSNWGTSKGMNDPAIQQTSANLSPATSDSMQAPLVNPQPKGSFMSSQRTTDTYGTGAPFSDNGSVSMPPPPPPLVHGLSGSSSMPSASTTESTSALITPPPPAPAGVTASTLPPLPGATDGALPPPPPVPSPLSGGK